MLRPGDNNVLPTTDGLDNLRTQLNLTAGPHTLTVTISADVSGAPVQARLNWVTPAQQQANTAAAVNTARHAKTAVVFAWSTGALDSPLPEGQDQLIADVAAVNPDTIVVLNTSDPVAMPWLGSVKAVLEMWYPGDTGGYATANVLLGNTDPAGRLPFTWPAALGQGVANQPATHPERTSNGVDATGKFCTTPGSPFGGPQCTTTYTEGIYVGYRWYDQQHLTPLYPFGYGLSYTHFGYSGLHWAPARDGGLDVAFRVTNTGSVTGDEVPQAYLGAPASGPAGVGLRRPGPGGLQPHHPAPGPVPGRVAARAAAPAPVLGHRGRALGHSDRAAAALCRRQRAVRRAHHHHHRPRRRALTHRNPR